VSSGIRRLPAPALLAILYLCFIAAGAVVLRLPVSHHGAVGWMDALFTSTSAVTVTGLVVVDTGSAFTFFGQAVIAFLIQMGGLGLMTFAVLLLSALGIPVGMPQKLVLREEVNTTSFSNLAVLVRMIFKIAIIVEVIGAALLSLVFVPEFGWRQGLWHAVFHAVSAFNNAGFALFPDSLSRWAADPLMNAVVPLMFIVSGLGFVVVGDIVQKRRWRGLSLHTKIMVVGTVALLAWGTVTFAVLEWSNPGTLGAMDGFSDKLIASWFQGATPRTAGFNTVDTAAMRDETALMTMTLMVIGGGSTSTAGGIKVATFIVLLLATVAFFRGRSDLNMFGRRLDAGEVMKVLALTTVSLILVMVSLFLLMLVEEADFLILAFEITSAFGTVGLSMGATGELGTPGELIVMVVMFLGRVGPLTLGFFLVTRSRPRVRFPKGQIYIG
jgi:trk system potassium uptake protein TrkH